MAQEDTEFFYILIPEDINRNWHGNDHLLKRIIGEKFPDSNLVINVIDKLSSRIRADDFDDYIIMFIFTDSEHTLFKFAKKHIQNSRVLIFTDISNPGESICPEAICNPRVQQINKKEINYTVFEAAMEILIPSE